jgi:hypothetical protein
MNSVQRRCEGNRLGALGAVALFLVAYAPSEVASAQALASPFATISQKVDSTTMTIEYYRPSARGRVLFGRLVRWGELWTPGANWATTLDVDRDIRIEGQLLPRGKYSVWMIPAKKPEPWTVVLSRAARRFHVVKPVPDDDQLRFRVAVDSGAHAELLTFSFPAVSRVGATLAFHWGETVVPIRLDVHSSRPTIAAAHAWSSYVGVYELRDGDSDSTARAIRYEIIERGNGLWVRTTADAVEPGLDTEFDLMPIGGDDFHPRQYKNGKLIGDEMDELITFRIENGRATSFEVRGIAEDKVLARGVRPRPR